MEQLPSAAPAVSPIEPLDRDLIARRLAGWLASGVGETGDDGVWRQRTGKSELTPAAVLIPLVNRTPGLTVLLTQRTGHLHDHAGQISFPGGRSEEGDASPESTALREAHEEIGLEPHRVELLGQLPEYITGTGFRVTPVVGWVESGFSLTLDTFEVAEAFEVPLGFFLDPANHQLRSLVWEGRERQFYAMPYADRFIWGATAGMLRSLYHALSAARQP